MRRFRQISDSGDFWETLQAIYRWGYPREIGREEFAKGIWYRWGDDLVFWLMEYEEYPGHAFFHIASDPNHEAPFNTRRFFQGLEVICECQGFEHVAIDLHTDLSGETDKHRRYCKRLGFVQNEAGWWVRDLD